MVCYIYSSIDAVYSLYYSNTLMHKTIQKKQQQQQKKPAKDIYINPKTQHNEVQKYR